MKRYAQIINNKVENVILWDGISPIDFIEGEVVLADESAWVGGSYESGAFIPQYTQEELDALEDEQGQVRRAIIEKLSTNLTSEEKLWLEENL
jgi:hypothetical protein